MTDKPEYVDLIRERTRQKWHRTKPRVIEAPAKAEEPPVAHWPPPHRAQWREELLRPWRLRTWKGDR